MDFEREDFTIIWIETQEVRKKISKREVIRKEVKLYGRNCEAIIFWQFKNKQWGNRIKSSWPNPYFRLKDAFKVCTGNCWIDRSNTISFPSTIIVGRFHHPMLPHRMDTVWPLCDDEMDQWAVVFWSLMQPDKCIDIIRILMVPSIERRVEPRAVERGTRTTC